MCEGRKRDGFCFVAHGIRSFWIFELQTYKIKYSDSKSAWYFIIDFSNYKQKLSKLEIKTSNKLNKHLAQELGARILSNVSKSTDFLIIGENPGSKLKKAKELNVIILKEKEWIEKIKT